MTSRRLKAGYFALAALNTLSNCYFFNYLFFLLRDRFGFGDRGNLSVSALYGFIYIFSAWQCGKFAQRRGFLTSLKVGFGGLTLLMAAGGFMGTAVGVIAVVAAYAVVLLFTWPALEALVSANESQAGVQHMVGIYNCTWSAAAALAYFTGGPLYDRLGGMAVFQIPAAILFLQFLIVTWLSGKARVMPEQRPGPDNHAATGPEPGSEGQQVSPEGFLKMAWLSNPFAYVAMNTLLAVMPGIASKLALSPTQVGFYCSVWFFGRFAAFAILWRWKGWHYRFRWLLSAFVTLVASFTLLLLTRQLWVFVVAQAFFGFAAGLIYYSSLFYSMDVGEASAEHGGLHEAAIGAGIFAGPAVGAATLEFLPRHSGMGVIAVPALLMVGLGGLLFIWNGERRKSRPIQERELTADGRP